MGHVLEEGRYRYFLWMGEGTAFPVNAVPGKKKREVGVGGGGGGYL